MKTSTINCTAGTYDTEYTIRDYGSKIVVTAPYVRWENNSGSLDFSKTTITNPKTMALIRDYAESGELVSPDPDCIVLQDVLNGQYRDYPID